VLQDAGAIDSPPYSAIGAATFRAAGAATDRSNRHAVGMASPRHHHRRLHWRKLQRYSGKGDSTLHDAPPPQSAGRISSGAARRYHLVAVTPLDLGAILTADRP
jgi:hypothetical protein